MLKRRSKQYLVFTVLTLIVLLSVPLLGGQTKNNRSQNKVSSSPAAKPETENNQSSTKQIPDPALAELIDRALDQSFAMRVARAGVAAVEGVAEVDEVVAGQRVAAARDVVPPEARVGEGAQAEQDAPAPQADLEARPPGGIRPGHAIERSAGDGDDMPAISGWTWGSMRAAASGATSTEGDNV